MSLFIAASGKPRQAKLENRNSRLEPLPRRNGLHKSPHIRKSPMDAEAPTGQIAWPPWNSTAQAPSWCELWLHTTYLSALAGQSHFRQSLNPTMPALPVGPSPGFQAVAFFCVVTSPNEAESEFDMSLSPPLLPQILNSLNKVGSMLCQEKSNVLCPSSVVRCRRVGHGVSL